MARRNMDKDYAEICNGVVAKPCGPYVFLKLKGRRKRMSLKMANAREAESWVIARFDEYYDLKKRVKQWI